MTGTIVTGLIVAATMAAIVVKLARDKRNGHCSGCGAGGNGCSSACCAKTKAG